VDFWKWDFIISSDIKINCFASNKFLNCVS
jgi:hypothetical protein